MATEWLSQHQGLEQSPLAALWRFRWFVLAMTLLGGGLAMFIAAEGQTTRYQATASLVVTDPRSTTLFSAAEASRLNAVRYVEDQVAILRSGSVAQRSSEVIAAASPELALEADEIAEGVEIFTTGTNEILVRYTARDEATAVSTVNAVIEAYGQVRREESVRESASAIDQLNQSIADIDAELADIEQQVLDLQAEPVRVDLDAQYQAALERVAVLQPLLARATGERLEELRAELADADEQLERLSRIISIEDGNPKFVQLDREQSQAVARRSALASQRDRLLVDTELLSGGMSLSSPAQFAVEITTDIVAITTLGALVGFLLGAGVAYLRASRRRKFTNSAQPGWILHSALLAEVPIVGEEGIASETPVLENPSSVSAEAFRFAATSLDLQLTSHDGGMGRDLSPVNKFLIASAGPSDGKTVLTANLALAAARTGRSVLVIDADFGNQRLSEILRSGRTNGPGITEVVESGLDHRAGVVSLGPSGGLDLMGRGLRPTTAPDFFSLPATKAFFEKVGRTYDMVLVDGPPMLHVAYASTLARYVDRIVVVVRHGSAVRQLEDLSQRLELIGTPVAGYIYNAAPLRYAMTITGGSLQDVVGSAAPIDIPHASAAETTARRRR